jgi:GT2 family glycosyltransferase
MVGTKPPLVSVIIVTYNGKPYLARCLQAVRANCYPNYEVIVADNGSTDGTTEYLAQLRREWPALSVVCLGYNAGPSLARNRAAARARGKYLAFLDNDTQPAPDWLQVPVELMEADASIGACQCKLLLLCEPHRIDYAGDYLSPLGFLIQRVPGGAEDTGAFDQHEEIFSAKSAAMVMRRSVFEQAGGFDPDYFIYVEETDLAWRVWLQGYRIIFVPESRVLHEFGTSSIILGTQQNYLVKFHGCKNYISTLVKNLEFRSLLWMLPVHVALWCAIAGWFVLKCSFTDACYIVQGIGWTVLHTPQLWQKRLAVQSSRRISDAVLLTKIMRRAPLSYFYRKMATPQHLGNAEGFFRRKARRS